MAKNAKKQPKEYIPEGMSRKKYADAAFKKKVTIINACILLAFFIGVGAVIISAWYNNHQAQQIEAKYIADRDAVKAQLAEIVANDGTADEKKKVHIELTDENFNYWIYDLDESYQKRDSADYRAFEGAEIHLQGMFKTMEYSASTQYWVYRKHTHDGEAHEHDHEGGEGEVDISEMVPIEVIFADKTEIPEDGTWVDVVGVVGVDSTNNLSAVRDAVMTIMDEPGQEYVE